MIKIDETWVKNTLDELREKYNLNLNVYFGINDPGSSEFAKEFCEAVRTKYTEFSTQELILEYKRMLEWYLKKVAGCRKVYTG